MHRRGGLTKTAPCRACEPVQPSLLAWACYAETEQWLAGAAITRTTRVKTGKRQVEKLMRRAAADVDAFCAERRPGPAPSDHVLASAGDGKQGPARSRGPQAAGKRPTASVTPAS